jgi:RNA recognition motif-containing protein
MVNTKVFVGNLSFKTKDAELAEHFRAVANVVSANIICRGPRSLGYGFVELESEEDAQKVIASLNKKEIGGRQINVEIAKPRDESAEGRAARASGGPRRGRGRFMGGRGYRGGRGGGRRRFFRPDGQQPNDDQLQQHPQQQQMMDPQDHQQQQQQQQRNFRRSKRHFNRFPRRRFAPENRVESKTTVFVANLPFSLTDETFGAVFTEAGLKYVKAHVVMRPNGRSKGFGFVEFESEEEQKKAISSLHGKMVEGRDMVLKVALTEQSQADGEDPAVSENP